MAACQRHGDHYKQKNIERIFHNRHLEVKDFITKYLLIMPNCVPPLIANGNRENYLKEGFFSTLIYL